jgi:SAM-dependent methyltransferase
LFNARHRPDTETPAPKESEMGDERTIRYYDEHAAEIFERYSAAGHGVDQYFGIAFPAPSRILDIGAGSGRDLLSLLSAGHDAFGIEPSRGLLDLALSRHPKLAGRLFAGGLPGLPADLRRPLDFDGVTCSAVFQHIPEAQQHAAALEIRGLLRPGGRALVSVPSERSDVGVDRRDPSGRLFTGIRPEELRRLFESNGFGTLGQWQDADSLGRRDVRWETVLVQRTVSGLEN